MKGLFQMRTLLCVAAAFLMSACATMNKPHVEIPAAPKSVESFDSRAAYFKNYQAQSKEADHLFLSGGERVYHPDDLAPAVDADSPAGKAISDFVGARQTVDSWNWLRTTSGVVASTGLVVGLGALLGPAILDLDSEIAKPIQLGGSALGGVMLIGGLTGTLLPSLIDSEAHKLYYESADRTWKLYNQSLSDSLRVGVDGNNILFDLDQAKPETPKPAAEPEGPDA